MACSILSRIRASLRPGARMMSVNSAPWLMLPPAFEDGDMVYKFYSLADKEVKSYHKGRGRGGGEMPDDDAKFVGSSHGWLALSNKHGNNDLFLSNPLSGRNIKLPPIDTLPDPEINLRFGVSKVIISHSPEEEDCRAMMSFGPGERLAICSPIRSTEWTPIGDVYYDYDEDEDDSSCTLYARAYDDFVYCSRKKLFTCITHFQIQLDKWSKGRPAYFPPPEFEDWDISKDPPILAAQLRVGYGRKKPSWGDKKNLSLMRQCLQVQHLVYDANDKQLFLVMQFVIPQIGPDGSAEEEDIDDLYPHKTIGFNVFVVGKGGKLRVVEDLGGLSMFVGFNHSFALQQASGLKPNSIYFTESKRLRPPPFADAYTNKFKIYGGHDVGIFDLQDKTVSPCYYTCDANRFKKIDPPPLWFTPSPV